MTFYDYKVTPAPKRLKRLKGVHSTAELFSATLSEAINAAARDGWEYLRAESLPATEQSGWFRRGGEVIETVLVFRRPRETLGPRLAAARAAPEAESPRLGAVDRSVERHAVERAPTERPAPGPLLRREPDFGDAEQTPTPLRQAPRLGPADQR